MISQIEYWMNYWDTEDEVIEVELEEKHKDEIKDLKETINLLAMNYKFQIMKDK
ncbi:MAG: hypothetical protein Ta2E_02020 [Mycoplasmoidaceae bacterium]|nr:MAG: hypothetical protein Ta2E_02020 [Mycoplasmoidaceae bacterium]